MRHTATAASTLALGIALTLIAHPATARAQATAAPRHHHVYGYLHDHYPQSDRVLLVWSKAHQTTYSVLTDGVTIFRQHGKTISRTALSPNAYVIVSGDWQGHLFHAFRVSLVIRHHRHKKAS